MLNGAQTSAALMASDFLLDELDRIMVGYPNDARSSRRLGGYAAAYGFDADEFNLEEEASALNFGCGQEVEDAEMSALFGTGGIPIKADDDY